MYEVKDSGERKVFESGMQRDTTEGKIDYLLILDGPMFQRWAEHMTKGAVKYTGRFPLTCGNWIRVIGECTCRKLVRTVNNPHGMTVEAVMRKAYDNVTQNSQNDSVRTAVSGQIGTVPVNALIFAITTIADDTENASWPDGDSPSKMNQPDATCVGVPQENAPLAWITTTQQDFLAAFSASSVISLSVTSRTVRNYLSGHLNTCPVLRYKVEGTSIVLPGKRNWMLADGQEELDRFRESALRHFIQWLRGDTDEDHAAAVMFGLNGAEYVREKMAVVTSSVSSTPRVTWTLLATAEV